MQPSIDSFKGKCAVCSTDLPPRRSRFCTNTCSRQHGIDRAKDIRARFKLTKKKCEFCGDKFQPKVAKHKYCSHACWYDFNAERLAEKRKEIAAKKPKTIGRRNFKRQHLLHIEGVKPICVRETQFTRATTPERVQLQSAVEQYLADGGLIKRYVIQPVYNTEEDVLHWGITERDEDEITERYK